MKNLIRRLLGHTKTEEKTPTFEDRISEIVAEEILYFNEPGLQMDLAKLTHAKERALLVSLLPGIPVPFVLEASIFPVHDYKCLSAHIQVTLAKRMYLNHLVETSEVSVRLHRRITNIYWVVEDSLRRQLVEVESLGVQHLEMDQWLNTAKEIIHS